MPDAVNSQPGHPKPEPPKHPLVAQPPPASVLGAGSAHSSGGASTGAGQADTATPNSATPNGVPPGRVPTSGPRAVLIGPPGSGKSTVAKGLAREWGVARRDTDDDIVRTSGKSISDIFLDDGEAAFRELEVAAVAAALGEHRGVLSLGGGAILNDSTQALIAGYAEAGGDVIFLDVSLTAAAPRVGLNNARPMLVGNPRRQWAALMEERRPIYERLATRTVNTDHLNARRIAHEIAGTVPQSDSDAGEASE